ncbi:keratin-associated protein 6-3 [Aquarana catesbeiana]|uniref:keratin-associated protein 6-3 n=1 Tax=Aquarana catesbeiana TaxID=8400 RepID=UPI003CCA2974
MNVSIERENGEPVFSAKLPVSLNSKNSSTIEIRDTDSSHPVAFIIKKKEGKFTQVIFQFPPNMEAALKAVILASFLYVGFRIREMSRSHSSGDSDFGWAGAGGVDFADMSHGGGGDWGGGGGDCGGGGGHCGGGGGHCGGGGGDCGGGGGGDGGGGH